MTDPSKSQGAEAGAYLVLDAPALAVQVDMRGKVDEVVEEALIL